MQQTDSMSDTPVADFSPLDLSAHRDVLAQAPTETDYKRAQEPASLTWAYRLLWLTFIIFFASTGIGKLWDRVWHATMRFDTFWSPPHLFVSVMTMMSGLLIAMIAFSPGLQSWFGPSIQLPIVKLRFAGSLIILGAGLVMLSITITLDSLWHTIFGLDETQWSVPHCMLGWCWLIIILGFISARMAFRPYRPISWLTNIVIALLILEFLCPAILGPFYLMYSPHLIHALANLPIVRGEPSAQHMYRIYLHYGLTRQTSPLFIPCVTLFAGTAIALLRELDPRARVFILTPFLWSLTLMVRDLYTLLFLRYDGIKHIPDVLPVLVKEPSLWLPIPLFVAVVIVALLWHTSFREGRILALSGMVFGVFTFFIWHSANWMILLAIPAGATMILGSQIGKWIYQVIEKPRLETLLRLLLTTCAQIPAALGVVDLIMRRTTP
ncbi:MAG: hypothetical protein NVS2B12_01770 [Ktedonobacteraceae bacterium]